MTAISVYITAGSVEEASRIGRVLVEERLAAWANVIDGMRSIYRWQGKIEEEPEAVLIAKTRTGMIDRLTERVRGLHSYDCPCVVGLPIVGGNPDYLDWIDAETDSSST